MSPPYCFLLIGLLLLCSTQTIAFAQSGTYQTIPESLRGYWQFKADNVSDWNGPLIGENFVENYYVVFYAEQIKQEADGSYFFHLRNQKGDTTEFRITPTGNDAATIWYKGWKLYPQASPRPHGTAHSPYIARPCLSEMGERIIRKSNLRIHP